MFQIKFVAFILQLYVIPYFVCVYKPALDGRPFDTQRDKRIFMNNNRFCKSRCFLLEDIILCFKAILFLIQLLLFLHMTILHVLQNISTCSYTVKSTVRHTCIFASIVLLTWSNCPRLLF